VVVKSAHGRLAAECRPVEETRLEIRRMAAHAMVRGVEPFIVEVPVRLRVELSRPDQVDRALRVPGAKRLDGVSVEWIGDNMVSVYHAFRAISALGN